MYSKKQVFWASCIGMMLFGITMTTLGAILPQVIVKFGIDKVNAGALITLMGLGILFGSIVFGPIVDRYGYKNLLIVCSALVLLGLEGIAFSTSFNFLRLAAFIFGFGGGVINGGTNALVSDISEESRSAGLALLGVFFGIGAFGVPFVLGILIDVFSYSSIIASVGLMVLIPIIFFILIRFPAPKHIQGFPIKEGVGLLKEATLLLMGFMLFFQSGMEFTVGGWTAAFFNEELMLGDRAVFFLSLYWLGIMLTRLVLGLLLKKVSPSFVLKISLGIAFIGALLMLVSRSLVFATPGIFLIGVGFAAVYPVVLGYIGDIYPKLSGTAFSIGLVMGLIGGMLFPFITGVLGDNFGLRISFIIIPISLICLGIILLIVLKRFKTYHEDVINI